MKKLLLAGLLLSTGLVTGPVLAGQSTQCVSNALAGGTVNAITIPLQPCGASTNLLILTLAGANSSTTVTLQQAGYPALPVLDSEGNPPLVGALPGAGAVVLLAGTGSSWLIVSGNATEGFSDTLGVSNGGTGQTTLTSNGILYGNGTSAVGVTAAGMTGQVLVGNTDSVPSWSAFSSLGVSSLSFGSTGLTPSGATQGAITVAGTLGVASGGTGQTSYTDGQLLIGNSSGNTLSKATITAGNNVTVTNGNGSITISSTGLASGCGTTGSLGDVLYDDGSGGCSSLGAGTSGQVLTSAGAGVPPSWEDASGGMQWGGVQATNFNAAVGMNYCVDTSGGAVQMTLPASPADGEQVAWVDCEGTFASAALTVARNGKNIMGLAENMTVNTVNAAATFVFVAANDDWRMQ